MAYCVTAVRVWDGMSRLFDVYQMKVKVLFIVCLGVDLHVSYKFLN
jgi:hypothetical protein